MIRHTTSTIPETFKLIYDDMRPIMNKGKLNSKEKIHREFKGVPVKTTSPRYSIFLRSTVCCVCGLEATHFAIERNEADETYHFNLYGTLDNGDEVLFTKDHIVPKAKGGKNQIDNYQTMCHTCNRDKSDNYEEKKMEKIDHKHFMRAVEVFEELGFETMAYTVAHHWFEDTLINTDYWQSLYEHYCLEMPYGTAKARTGDPDTWITSKLNELIGA